MAVWLAAWAGSSGQIQFFFTMMQIHNGARKSQKCQICAKVAKFILYIYIYIWIYLTVLNPPTRLEVCWKGGALDPSALWVFTQTHPQTQQLNLQNIPSSVHFLCQPRVGYVSITFVCFFGMIECKVPEYQRSPILEQVSVPLFFLSDSFGVQ